MTPTLDERIERLQSHYLANRIIRKAWHEGALLSDGYERACILAAFSPEAAEREDASACPADAMPPWLACLTSSLEDNVSDEAWPSVIARYVAVVPKMVRLPADRLVRLDFETRAVAVREGRSYTTNLLALEAIDGVLSLLDRAALGKEVLKEEWAAAADAAWETRRQEAEAAWAAAAGDAAWAAVARETAAASAVWAAYAAWAAWAATGAASAAWAAWAAVTDAANAATDAAWDRMADAMLSAWETAV